MAYQHKISLLEEEIKQMREEGTGLIDYGEELVKENDFLRKELQRKGEYVLQSEQIGINVNFIRLDNASLNEKNKILAEKNEFLLEKIKELSKSL